MTFRHFDGTNLAFADGHVEYRSFQDVYFGGDRDKINQLFRFDGGAFSNGEAGY